MNKPDFTAVSDVLKSEIARLGGPKVQHLLTLQKIWPSIVNSDIAAHTHVSQYTNNTLTITADHPAWLTELNLMKGELLSILRSKCPQIAVAELVFRLGKMR